MRKVTLTLALALLAPSLALAQPAAPAAPSYPMQVSTRDQQSLRQICALAQKEPSLSLEQATGIGQYCLGLVNRIGLALSAKQPSESKIGEPNKPAAAHEQKGK